MAPASRKAASSRSGTTRFPPSRRRCNICCAPKPPSARFRWPSAQRRRRWRRGQRGPRSCEPVRSRARHREKSVRNRPDRRRRPTSAPRTSTTRCRSSTSWRAARKNLRSSSNNTAQSLQQRWQQEMLRREAEELQRQMEQLAQQNQNGQQGQQPAGQQSVRAVGSVRSIRPVWAIGIRQSGQSPGSRADRQSGQQVPDPRVQQALERLSKPMTTCAGRFQPGSAEARRAADRLREATNLLGGAQQQHANGRLDSMSREADRLAQQEKDQQQKLGQMPSPSALAGRFGQSYYGYGSQGNSDRTRKSWPRSASAWPTISRNCRSRCATPSAILLRTSVLRPNKLRDALGDLDTNELENRIQRSADWLRRGVNPNSPDTEQEIASSLQNLSDQLRQAQQALGDGSGSSRRGHRSRSHRAPPQPIAGHEPGWHGNGQRGQQGQPGQSGQQGQRSQRGPRKSGRAGQANAQDGRGDNQPGGMNNGYSPRGGFGTTIRWRRPRRQSRLRRCRHRQQSRIAAAGRAQHGDRIPAICSAPFSRTSKTSEQLRRAAAGRSRSAAPGRQLIQEMQRLDPRRFPGNPALVEQLHTQVLNDVDKLELQLRRQADDKSGQIRSSDSAPVPSGYQDAVAEYFRRLSNNSK